MRLQNFIMNEGDPKKDKEKEKERADSVRKKSKQVLTKGLRKLEDQMDVFVVDIEKEIDKIEDNPVFKQHMGLMLTNMEKEQSEYIIALRQIINTLGKKASVIPQVRAHAKGSVPEPNEDDKEDVRDQVDKEQEQNDEKNK